MLKLFISMFRTTSLDERMEKTREMLRREMVNADLDLIRQQAKCRMLNDQIKYLSAKLCIGAQDD